MSDRSNGKYENDYGGSYRQNTAGFFNEYAVGTTNILL